MSGRVEYDIHAYESFLRSGQKMACVAADDNHSLSSTCGGWIQINADKLDYKTIINALENHDFYASTGPEIKELYVEGNKAHITFSKGEYALMSTKGRRVKKVLAENPNGENKAEFEILPTDGYIRFDVVNEKNQRAHTSAYFLEDL